MILSNYTIKSELGRGGMATVFLGHDNKFDSNVAVKVLNKEFVHNENIRKRFLAEARSMFKMSHPNIIKVTDLIEESDTIAFVMEYIEGETLKDYIDRKGKLSDEEIKNIFTQMLDAVGYVHEQNLVHRDIKPSNFMLDKKGRIKLMDFGIAKTTDTSSAEYTQTGTGVQMGTPMYMSPEQITETRSVTAQSDIYSLGVVLWNMVTGKKPYDANTTSTFELQTKIVNEKLLSTATIFDVIIEKSTAKNLGERYKNCGEFKNNLENLQKENNENAKAYTSKNSENTKIETSADKTIVENNDNPKQFQQQIKNTTNRNAEIKNEQKVIENLSSSEILINGSLNKSLKLLTTIKIISFAIFLFLFYLISKNEVEAQYRIFFENNDFEYWQNYLLEFTRGASIISFIFIGFTLLYIISLFKKLINLGYEKWIIVFRIIASIFMFSWSILLFTSTGGISVHEVQVAWYIYICLEILLDISTLKKIKL